MALAEVMGAGGQSTILLGGKAVEYRLVPSRAARKLRIKVKPHGIEVVVPEGRTGEEALAFVAANQGWAVEQLTRARRLAALRRPEKRSHGQVLFQGESVPVQVIRSEGWRAPNRVLLEDGRISITCAPGRSTSPSRSLENWLRKQARDRIEQHLEVVAKRIKRSPRRVYVMGQRTKWGNCSALGNLSFNWRLIMAPEYVLRYIVTHEMVHLAIPDHSQRFWLTVQSLCPQADRARQWLVANGDRLRVDMNDPVR
jgi:predicted metal-dependent hydrolase